MLTDQQVNIVICVYPSILLRHDIGYVSPGLKHLFTSQLFSEKNSRLLIRILESPHTGCNLRPDHHPLISMPFFFMYFRVQIPNDLFFLVNAPRGYTWPRLQNLSEMPHAFEVLPDFFSPLAWKQLFSFSVFGASHHYFLCSSHFHPLTPISSANNYWPAYLGPVA